MENLSIGRAVKKKENPARHGEKKEKQLRLHFKGNSAGGVANNILGMHRIGPEKRKWRHDLTMRDEGQGIRVNAACSRQGMRTRHNICAN